MQELCLHTKLLAPTTMTIAEFLGRCPQPPPFLIIRNAVSMLKVLGEAASMLRVFAEELEIEMRQEGLIGVTCEKKLD